MIEIKNIRDKILVLLSIFLVSISLFIYQVVLTRIYSAILWYHYVFLITSLAIFGLGIGSIVAYIKRNKTRKRSEESPGKGLSNVIFMLAISYFVILSLIYILPFQDGLLIYVIMGTIPFIIGGYFFSNLFTQFSGISNKLYFADLMGSGAGSILVILLLNNAGMYRTIILISLIALVSAIIFKNISKKIRFAMYFFVLLLIAGQLLPRQYINAIEKNFNGIITNTEKTFGSLKKAGFNPEIVYTKWNAFSRTDVISLGNEYDQMIVTIDGSANAPMYKFDGNIDSLDYLKKDLSFLPFVIGNNEKSLLIGPGGGRDVLYALAGRSIDITAVEINSSSIDAVKALSSYNGNIYERPEVKVFGEDGRNFVRKSKDKYDLIFMSLVMTNTSQGIGYSLSENYIFTVEAMEEYLDKLNDNGKIAFISHDQQDLSKIISTVIVALNKRGIPVKDTPNYIALFTENTEEQHINGHLHYPIIIIKNEPFSERESQTLIDYAKVNNNIPLYAPLLLEQGPLQYIKEEQISIDEYLKAFITNVHPATDDNPYFYNFNKGVPSILKRILFISIVGSIILFAFFVLKDRSIKPMTYFSLLGAGFMMIEIPLIHRFILYLGHPVTAFTYVLAALLAGCGLGGYFSKHFDSKSKIVYIPPVLVVLLNIILILSLGIIFKNTADGNLTGKIILSVALVMLQGFFMGMPFPRGIRLLGESGRSSIIPVMWGVNGVTSVIGSVLSIILSMTFGFTWALIAGGAVYIMVSFFKKI